jgi:hypothetical protein
MVAVNDGLLRQPIIMNWHLRGWRGMNCGTRDVLELTGGTTCGLKPLGDSIDAKICVMQATCPTRNGRCSSHICRRRNGSEGRAACRCARWSKRCSTCCPPLALAPAAARFSEPLDGPALFLRVAGRGAVGNHQFSAPATSPRAGRTRSQPIARGDRQPIRQDHAKRCLMPARIGPPVLIYCLERLNDTFES